MRYRFLMVSSRMKHFAMLLLLCTLSLLIGSSAGFLPMPPRNRPFISSASPSKSVKINSLKKTPLPSRTTDHYFVSTTTIFAERKRRLIIPSITRFLPGLSSSKDSNALVTGLETALVLGNKQRRAQWTREATQQFSWIPSFVIEMCIDGLASAYEAVAPRDLKQALTPGGLTKVRTKLQNQVIQNLQPMLDGLPMIAKSDKDQLIEYLVDLSLDFFLNDLESKLAAPSTKLTVLDRERKYLLQSMTMREFLGYRVRQKPKPTIFTIWSIVLTLWFVHEHRKSIVLGIQKFLSSSLSFLTGILLQGISSAKAMIPKFIKSIISMLR